MRNLILYLVTWNVADRPCNLNDSNLLKFLGNPSRSEPDLIIVGLQEAEKQETWKSSIKGFLKKLEFVTVKTRNLSNIHIMVFIRHQFLPMLTNVESELSNCGFGNIMGNKGGAVIRFDLFDVNFAAVVAHFEAHEENVKERIKDYEKIIETQTFRDPDIEKLLDHEYVFWMGDLNFRLEDISKENVERQIRLSNWKDLVRYDQLKREMERKNIFDGFNEAELNFPPTYKFDIGSNNYDSSKKQRVPSWTDRILYRVKSNKRPDLAVECLQYNSIPDFTFSDHKPVYALFSVKFPELRKEIHPVTFITIMSINMEKKESRLSSNVVSWIGRFSYCVDLNVAHQQQFELDSKDYIALLPANFNNLEEDCLAKIPAPISDIRDVSAYPIKATMNQSHMKKSFHQGVNTVCLVYFSRRKNCATGYGKPFQIICP